MVWIDTSIRPIFVPRNERPQYWPSEQGDVLRKQHGTEREHPESQHRKETENSEDDQQ
jgi:hypothetical protein